MKCFLKLDDDIKSWKNHKKNLKLSKIWKAIIDKSIGVGFNLNEIGYITNTRGQKEVEKTINIVKTRRKLYTNKTQFYNTDEKRIILYQKDLNSNVILKFTV